MKRSDAHEWKQAADDEMNSLLTNKTWILVNKPEGKNLVSCKWVFKSKLKSDGSLDRRKARLVARGFTQTAGMDYFETFSPTSRYESVRCVLALAASWDMDIVQFDVKTAFLNSKLEEDVHMTQPEGYDDKSGRVCKLLRSLYGLKQSSRNWYSRFSSFLEHEGFERTPEDECVFVRNQDRNKLIICLYVDDGLVCGTSHDQVHAFISKLELEFHITTGEPDHYVGMEIHRNRSKRQISITQKGYIKRVLERFGLADSKSLIIPMIPSLKLDTDSPPAQVPYRQAIGCLNYLSMVSRPDITYAVNKLARYCNAPTLVHWQAVKRVMKYLKGTQNYCITYSGTDNMTLEGSCDSDWGGGEESDEKKSTSGYIFTMCNGPVTWASRLQKVSAESACEAEYMALTEAMNECLWLRPFLSSLGHKQVHPTRILQDNQASINLVNNPEFHRRTKHIGIKYHRVRQEKRMGTLIVDYVESGNNIADCLTKGVTSVVLHKNLTLMNMDRIND